MEAIPNIVIPMRRKKKRQESKKRISSMILLNGLNFLILRTPVLVVSFYGFFYRYDKSSGAPFPDFISYHVCRTFRFHFFFNFLYFTNWTRTLKKVSSIY